MIVHINIGPKPTVLTGYSVDYAYYTSIYGYEYIGSMDIHGKSVDMDMDGKFHIHGKLALLRHNNIENTNILSTCYYCCYYNTTRPRYVTAVDCSGIGCSMHRHRISYSGFRH